MAFGSESEDSSGQTLGSVMIQEFPNSSTSAAGGGKIDRLKRHRCVAEGCKASFSRPWRLQAHLSVHLGESPFQCDVAGCEKSYTSQNHLTRHKKTSHCSQFSPSRLYPCTHEGCNAVLKTGQNLKKHMKRAHTSKICSECNTHFSKMVQLKHHMQFHTGVFIHECEECDLKFARKTEYNRHMRKHRVHVCPRADCIFAFSTWSMVRKHMKTHDPSYVCHYCGKPSYHKGTFRQHVLTHLPDRPKRPTKLKPYTCHFCNESILGKQSLRRHMKTIHLNPKKRRPPLKGEERKPRRDKGKPKSAAASDLSGVTCSKQLSNRLLESYDPMIEKPEDVLDALHDELIS